MPPSTGSIWLLSPRWRAVGRAVGGRPLPSRARSGWVVNPPRLRPSASSAGVTSPFFRRRWRLGLREGVARSRRVLMGPDGRPVDRDHRPDDLPDRLRCALEGLEHLLPNPLPAPAQEPVVA